MRRKMRLLFAVPFLVLPALLVVLLSSCQRSGFSPSERVQAAHQAVQGAPCDAGSCRTLDEFDISLADASGGGWLTFTCDDGGCVCDAGACDITVALQEQVNTIVQNTNASVVPGAGVQPTILYIPSDPTHAYNISSTIWVQGAYGGAIVGDPSGTTTINWTGSVGGSGMSGTPMFLVLNSVSTKIARITLNGGLSGALEGDGGSPPWLTGIMVMDSPKSPDGGGPPTYAPPYLPDDGGVAAYHAPYFFDFDDDVFENLSFGITGTGLQGVAPFVDEYDEASDGGNWFSEHTQYDFDPGFLATGSNLGNSDVRRCSFENISVQGIALMGYNTLDWLIEDSSFINCHRGLTLSYYASAIMVNNLFFNNNNDGDDSVNVFTESGSHCVYRGNVSVGANMFYVDLHGAAADIAGNYVVLNPEMGLDGGAGNPHCYAAVSQGAVTLLDNYISGPSNGDECSLEGNGYSCVHGGPSYYGAFGMQNGEIVHGHNAYSGTAAGFVGQLGQSGYLIKERCVGGDGGCAGGSDTADSFGVLDAGGVPDAAWTAYVGWGSPQLGWDAGAVTRPTIAPAMPRTVIAAPSACLAPTGGCSATSDNGCSAAVNTALGSASGPTLLYFPRQQYCIDHQIEIPSNLDVVIAGDVTDSVLMWVGSDLDAYVFHAKAPSQAMFRDFVINAQLGKSRPGGILIDSQDDANGLVYADMLGTTVAKSGVTIAGLDKVLVRAEQFGFSGERGVEVIGGGGGYQDGGTQSSQTQGLFMLSGGGATFADFVSLRNWGKAVIVGTDNEGNQGMALSQSGFLTIDNGRFVTYRQPDPKAYSVTQPNVVVQSTFRGNVTFANMDDHAAVISTGARQAQVLVLGNQYQPSGSQNAPPVPACQVVGPPPGACWPVSQADTTFVMQASNGATQMGIANSGICSTNGVGQQLYDVSNGSASPSAFADTMLADLRQAPYAAPICSRTCGETQVRIHNVTMTGGDQSYGDSMPSRFMRSGLRVQRSN